MKLAPLVPCGMRFVARKTKERYAQIDALTTMTHKSDEAHVTSRVHGDVLHMLLHLEHRGIVRRRGTRQAVL